MKKENKKRMSKRKKLIVIVLAVILSLGFIGLLTFAILDAIASEKSIVRLGEYSSLTYTATDRDTAGTQVVDSIVEKTRFGGLIQGEANTLYNASMSRYQEDAKNCDMTLERYAEVFFSQDLKSFEKVVKEESLKVARYYAVVDAIAEREQIVLSDEQFERLLPDYMESVAYTDRDAFFRDYRESEIREQMLRDITVDYLLEHAKGPELTK